MKRKEIKSLHEKTSQELTLMLRELRDELGRIRLGITKSKNARLAYTKTKDVARVLTVLKEKEFSEKEAVKEVKNG